LTRLLTGKPIADEVAATLAPRVVALREAGVTPVLSALQYRPDPSARFFVERMQRSGARVGVSVVPEEVSTVEELHAAIARRNSDPATHGITVLAPLPPSVDVADVMERLDPRKDVEGLHPYNAGRLASEKPTFIPYTAEAILLLLRASRIQLAGARAVVVGRSIVVGRPASLLLMYENATVTLAHRGTHDLAALTREAEILVVAIGRPAFVGVEMVRPGAVVVDAGINATPDGVVGDVDFERVSHVAAAITPVPGGVGSLTTMLLLRNAARAAERLAASAKR
jgi:methylenetetrahydrofolate dehydrogenase (NADP+)/methenyltetrahydrofolate cyclohydrolase